MSLKSSPIRRLELFGKDSSSVHGRDNLAGLNIEIDRLNALVHTKNVEIKQLLDENKLMKLDYQDQIESYRNTIALLEGQLAETENSRQAEFLVIKQKYDKIQAEESDTLMSYHSHQMQFLLKEIAHLRIDCEAKQEKLILKEKQLQSVKDSYEREISEKITEVNNLNRSLLAIEDYKNREIKEISSKIDLERSRTSGIVSSRKENNQFMDKQLRKLNEEVLEKSIKVENLNRELNKAKRKIEESERIYSKKFEDMLTERDEENRQRQEHFAKIEKALKDELLQFKGRELQLMGDIDRQKDQIQSLKGDIRRLNQTVQSKEEQNKGYKELLQKQREFHANEISNLMKQRKKKSSSKMGSSRSLNSSYRAESPPAEEIQHPLKQTESVGLPTVREESPDRSLNHSLERSNVTEDHMLEQDDNQLAKAVYHYDTLIQQLKRSHFSEIQLLKHKYSKVSKNLQDKQKEILEILTRFSPLVKIHAEEKSIEQDRKERIERHWKADLALLDIMLRKYNIKAYE